MHLSLWWPIWTALCVLRRFATPSARTLGAPGALSLLPRQGIRSYTLSLGRFASDQFNEFRSLGRQKLSGYTLVLGARTFNGNPARPDLNSGQNSDIRIAHRSGARCR